MSQLMEIIKRIPKNLNRYSKIITQKKENGAAQAMLYSLGLNKNDLLKPQIGVCSMWYQGNPCNSKLNILSNRVSNHLKDQNLLPMEFNTIGISDGISMGTSGMRYSLPSRELICDSIESVVKGLHYDSLVCIPGCDKNLPGSVMAMVLLDRPSLMIYGGSMKPSYLDEKNNKLDIVSAFEAYGKFINKEISNEERQNIIENSCDKGCGSCSGLYTANTMAIIFEVMGLMLPNSSSAMSLSNEKMTECISAGEAVYNLLKKDIKPSNILTKTSFKNAIKILYLTGGSTNAVIHLLAVAKMANIDITLDDFNKYQDTPVLLNMKPHGTNVMYDLYNIGGTSTFIKYLIENNLIDGNCLTVTGKTLYENVKHAKSVTKNQDVIYMKNTPFKKESHIRILKGNMAPNGCISKISSDKDIFKKEAIVFNKEKNMLKALEDGQITKDHFVIIRYQGESIGCPEMLTPTSALIGYFGKDAPPVATDGRFSGGSHGILICHLPDAYKANSMTAIIRNGDSIILDIGNNSITLDVEEDIIADRLGKVIKPSLYLDGYLSKYRKTVGNIDTGYSTY